MNLSECSSQDFKAIAEQDTARLRTVIYQAADRNWAEDWTLVAHGRGPVICTDRGYETFKLSYMESEAFLKKTIPPLLRDNQHRLVLGFVSYLGCDNTTCVPSNYFQYRIYKPT